MSDLASVKAITYSLQVGNRPGKMCYALGYYLPIVSKECKFDLVELREDMCVSLQLLLKGYPNAIWTETVVDQRRLQCTRWRERPAHCREIKY